MSARCLCGPADYGRCEDSLCGNRNDAVNLAEDEDEVEGRACSHCGAMTAPDKLEHYGEDADFCPPCGAAWRQHFAECAHSWEPHVDPYGDAGQLCSRCGGFVALDVADA